MVTTFTEVPEWVVVLHGGNDLPEVYGPFPTEDDCYKFAARVSQEPNDWTPTRLLDPDDADPKTCPK